MKFVEIIKRGLINNIINLIKLEESPLKGKIYIEFLEEMYSLMDE